MAKGLHAKTIPLGSANIVPSLLRFLIVGLLVRVAISSKIIGMCHMSQKIVKQHTINVRHHTKLTLNLLMDLRAMIMGFLAYTHALIEVMNK